MPAGGSEGVWTANEELTDASGAVIKPTGGVSLNDIATALVFNNDLVIITITAEEIVGLLEYGVSALPGVAEQFPQIAGVIFSFNPDLPAGDRVVNAGVFDEDGALIAPLVVDGAVVNPEAEFRVTTLGFLAGLRFDESGAFFGEGDGYPFPNISDPEVAARVNLLALAEDGARTGDAVFADDGAERDALAEYLDDEFADEANAFAMADTGRDLDARIQNLDFRADAVFGAAAAAPTIQISENLYNPSSAEDDWEWVEIYNPGDEAVDLAGWVLDDANGVFHDPATIASGSVEAGGTAVLYNADDVSAADLASAWGAALNLVAVTDWSANALNNGGDTVALWCSFADYDGDEATFANPADRVDYDDSGDWPTDDGAASIHLTDLAADNNDGINWALSAVSDATPTGAARQAAIRMSRTSRRTRLMRSPSRRARRSAFRAQRSSPSTRRRTALSSPPPPGSRCLMSPTSTISRSSPRSTPPISASRPPPSPPSISPTGSWRRPARSGRSSGGRLVRGRRPGSVLRGGDVGFLRRLADRRASRHADLQRGRHASSRRQRRRAVGRRERAGRGGEPGRFGLDHRGERGEPDDVDVPEVFNSDGHAGSFDDRSDNKGPEPEGVAIGEIGGQAYAFIGLERVGGVMVYDVTTPEGLELIAADDSPTGFALLAVSNEGSETLTFLEINGGVAPDVTLISAIQSSSGGVTQVGVDDGSALKGETVTIRAVVTADFQSGENGRIGSDLSGLFVQEEESDYDNDASTSEGVFIFNDFAAGNPDVEVGDVVEVTGAVGERFGRTQLSAYSEEVIGEGMAPAATFVDIGSTGAILDADGAFVIDLEALEGMLITVPEAFPSGSSSSSTRSVNTGSPRAGVWSSSPRTTRPRWTASPRISRRMRRAASCSMTGWTASSTARSRWRSSTAMTGC